MSSIDIDILEGSLLIALLADRERLRQVHEQMRDILNTPLIDGTYTDDDVVFDTMRPTPDPRRKWGLDKKVTPRT